MTQILISGAIGLLVSIFVTPMLIRRFSAEGLGQEIREDGPKSHLRKRGTPTMGGIAILVGITVAYLATAIYGEISGQGGFTVSGVLVLGLTLSLGGLGFADDFIKLYKGRNLGLNKKAKLVGQLAIALIFGGLVLGFPDENGLTPGSTHLSFLRDLDTVDLAVGPAIVGIGIFLVFIYILISAWSNAVNLTDGLDGLAAGSTAIVMGTYTLITFWQFRNACTAGAEPGCYDVRDPLDLAILAAAGLGACLGFLWWNAAPAKIFMGDTGSLALGGLVAGLSVASRTELLMVIVGALFVLEAASVVIQVIGFRTKGIRIFRMAPFHHHFENGGWAETTVVIRFWLIAALAALIGASAFYGEWLSLAGV
ncbi:phospho-N-acetylmuramoyl-pentapeptide-transferase [Corynebacterium pseudotuberculosis]|uniref:Phospho-N-acetylmuramoyl-pentapeptide-transferase n=1 Tax=Corynebacterium pseudotuberculosis (strain C231) TaxID=681645 RepID=D9QBD8_CORP2|nr:phospho-N-acetylmuramoyl-pentapeptide-transferase [Corynebacterium pseudotuberculosis]ADL10864.1 phospho-N-acetylmuramoyl-pentapeptide-transferase [Corynebacterium pseudotuberculosis C231]ADO26663.1 phospho-N-acetylmuramoyl-pentapeptide-transferase [Corynebacterium pseudotuberculosis I19]AEK92725.1 Phospho-N-acetylmuramoyl-pentapeptide-transferase [Corynebacterium pseudotuberculosis PAT10]AEP70633.1 Phospho-N-acetylmuramoyl-pentapeptide-transferase [Corynebacterium pseudotuberculosis 42/02-A